MKMFIIGSAAAATLLAAVPAAAQPEQRHHGWDAWWHDWWHSGWARDHYDGWLRGSCRIVTVKERLPDGRVITRSFEQC